MPLLRIRVSSALKFASQDAAERSGSSLSEWARVALDAASGHAKLPLDFARAGPPVMTPNEVFRGGTITIRVAEGALKRYQSSAAFAWLELSAWAAVVLAVASGISDLPKQINRLKNRKTER